MLDPLDKPNLSLAMLVFGWSVVLESLNRTVVVLNCYKKHHTQVQVQQQQARYPDQKISKNHSVVVCCRSRCWCQINWDSICAISDLLLI